MKRYLILAWIVLAVIPALGQVRFSEEMPFACEDVKGMVYDGVHIWVNHGHGQLSAVDPQNGQKLLDVNLAVRGEALAYDGRNLLLVQNESKRIFAVDRATGNVAMYIDLATITGERDLYLEPLRSGEIMGIAFGDNRLWVASSAGYSSSIYEIDPVRCLVISHRYAPGPAPAALVHSNGNLWVLDKDQSVLRCLKGCEQLVYDLSIAVEDAVTLLDMPDKVFVARQGRAALQGVAKKALNGMVPDQVDTTAIDPYLKQIPDRVDGPRKVGVLISGDTAASGFNEFWIDVVIMYRILEKRGYNEIYVLYADGKDYNCGWDKYQITMTDFAGTKANVAKVLNALASGDSQLNIAPLGLPDTLFVYTFDHGDSQGKLCLWKGERYAPSEMAEAVRNINCKEKFFYMQQCFSGAFKEQFKSGELNSTAIVTACSNSQYAYRADTEYELYNGKKFYHGEFNWHFMSALQGETPKAEKVDADANADGKVSIDETYEYYKKANSQPRQTPQYHSNPESVGKTTP